MKYLLWLWECLTWLWMRKAQEPPPPKCDRCGRNERDERIVKED